MNLNHEIHFFFFKYAIRCEKIKDFGSGLGSKFNSATRVGSDELRYGPGSVFSLKPVQTSTGRPMGRW